MTELSPQNKVLPRSPKAPGQMFSRLDSGNKFYSKKMFADNNGKANSSKREVPKVLFELNIGDK